MRVRAVVASYTGCRFGYGTDLFPIPTEFYYRVCLIHTAGTLHFVVVPYLLPLVSEGEVKTQFFLVFF